MRHPRIFRFWYLFFLGFVCAFQTAHAEVWALLVGDTQSPTHDAVSVDLTRLKHELSVIALHTGQKVQCATLSGEQVAAETIMKSVEDLKIQPEDTVIFYFLGHGYRTSVKEGQWPFLYLCQEDRGLDLTLIIESLISKKPHMALVIADCCNNIIDDDLGNPWEPRASFMPCGSRTSAGYRTLFNDFEGVIIACSSTPGEYAYCRPTGHLFTAGFLCALHLETTSRSPNWTTLLNRASAAVQKYQHPCYEILTFP